MKISIAKQRYQLLPLALALLFSCTDRQRSNPLDPLNPQTGGRVQALQINSYRDSAYLSWQGMGVEGLEGYVVQRARGQADFGDLGLSSPDSTWWLDTGLEMDSLVRYRVRAITSSSESEWSEAASLIPGPYIIWLVDFYDFSATRMRYDGGAILETRSVTSPTDIVSTAAGSRFYIAEYWNQRILILDTAMEEKGTYELSGAPVSLCFGNGGDQLAVLLTGDQLELIQTGTGSSTVTALGYPIDLSSRIDLDQVDDLLWISTATMDSLLIVDIHDPSTSQRVGPVPGPRRIAADSRLGGCWVASDSGLYHFRQEGLVGHYKPDFSIADVSLNNTTADVYYTGQQRPEPHRWTTGRISSSTLVDEELLGPEVSDVHRILAIPGAGKHGFLVMQLDGWRIRRYDGKEQLIGEQTGFNGSLEFALQN